jgi:2-dehydropantoate 2-reductase
VARIVVVGSGAVGLFYGARLQRAGHEVVFVARRDRAALRERGLLVESPEGSFRLEQARAVADASEAGRADWVICSLKATALDVAPDLCAPAVGPDTRLVVLMNGFGVEDPFVARFGTERVLGAMAFVGVNRGEPGVVHHIAYGRVTVGHVAGDTLAAQEFADLLQGAGLEALVAPSLRFARWEKLCWNVPFNGLSVAAGGVGTRTVLEDDALADVAERAMREVVAVANADLAAHGEPHRLDPQLVVERMFAQTRVIADYRTSMLIDYLEGRPLEVEAILGAPLRRARELGVDTPTIAALYALVRHADRRNLARAATSP